MAKKQEKEIERWVTVNGARVPIFKDGSIGGPKALREAYKKAQERKKFDNEHRALTKHEKIQTEWNEHKRRSEQGIKTKYAGPNHSKLDQHSEIQKMADEHVRKIWTKEGGVANKELYDEADKFAEKHNLDKKKVRDAAMKAMSEKHSESVKLKNEGKDPLQGVKERAKDRNLSDASKTIASKESAEGLKRLKEKYSAKEDATPAKKVPEHITDAKSVNELHDKLKSQGLSMESADASAIKRDYRSMNGEKVSLYDKDGNEYRGTFNRYSDGGTEIVNIKKERYNTKDDDTKEKQIARNKAEADERNKKSKEDIARDKETFRKAKEHEARVKTKAQASKQAVKDIKQGLKEYGPKRGMWQDVKKADAEWKRISKLFSTGQISNEAYEEIYYLFGENFHRAYKTRNIRK